MSDRYQLAQKFKEDFLAFKSFKSITEARIWAADWLGRKIESGTAQAKNLEEAIEAGVVLAAREIVRQSLEPREIFKKLVDLYHRQPNLNTRSSQSIAQQAYSTPIAIAYLAATLADIQPHSRVYEGCAGNGALLLTCHPSQCVVNELNPERAAFLRQVGFETTQSDAVNYRPPKIDRILLNPPFGKIERGNGSNPVFSLGQFQTKSIDQAICLNSLECLTEGGKAVLIIGSNLGKSEQQRSDNYNGKQTRAFFYQLYGHYNVTQHLTLSGDLYRRQGASFPIDLILIEGRGQSALPLPAVKVPPLINSYAELESILVENLSQRSRHLESHRGSARSPSRRPAAFADSNRLFTVYGASERSLDLDDLQADGAIPGRGRGNAGLNAGISSRTVALVRPDGVGNQARRPVRTVGQPVGAGVSGERAQAPPGRTITGIPSDSTAGLETNDLNNGNESRNMDRTTDLPQVTPSTHVPYLPKSQGQSVKTLIPINLQESVQSALNHLEAKVGDIDRFACDRLHYGSLNTLHQYFSAEQVDALALAIDNVESGDGFILGDQTGIGKGRVMAGMMRYARMNGRIPLFFTQNPKLYSAIIQDLHDIGEKGIKPFPTNADVTLKYPDGRTFKTHKETQALEMAQMAASEEIGDYYAIFSTYSQVQTVKGEETLRQDFLERLAPKCLLLLDESHEAGGAISKNQRGEAVNTSKRAEYIRRLVSLADGVIYSSATYAKRPDIMDLYKATDMRLAFSDISKLQSVMDAGGIPMQQAVAGLLTRSGQYLRRERSYEGVNFNTKIVEIEKDKVNQLADILSGIASFDQVKRKAMRELGEQYKSKAAGVEALNSVGDIGITSTGFASVMHNLINQMFLALKAEAIVKQCQDILQAGKKPLITLYNTMGSFIEEYARERNLKADDPIDLSFNDLLQRYLDKSRQITITQPTGEKEKRLLTDEELGDEGVALYEDLSDRIHELELDIPISPIDFIRQKLEAKGIRTGELTGRQHGVLYGSDGKLYYRLRPKAEAGGAAALKTVEEFNSGESDLILFNESGSTGISLHASEKFKDQRPRHMLVAQPQPDINDFVQSIGRIFRTGQVNLPEYTLFLSDTPAELRIGSVLLKKMATLNANTNAARNNDLSLEGVPDLFNEYGDMAAVEVMQRWQKIHSRLGHPLNGDADRLEHNEAIRKLTGRIALLRYDEQVLVYEELTKEYDEIVLRQKLLGESILEAATLDLKAKTLARMEIAPARNDKKISPFTEPVYVEVVEAQPIRHPYTQLQAVNQVRQSINLEPVENLNQHDFQALDKQSDNWGIDQKEQVQAQAQIYLEEQEEQINPVKYQKLRDRVNDSLRFLNNTLGYYRPGTKVKITTEKKNVFYGVVGSLYPTATQEPSRLSAWRMRLLIADSVRELIVPLSQINNSRSSKSITLERATVDLEGTPIYEAFDQAQKATETLQIVTGNYLSGFEKLGAGSFVNFTDAQGTMRQGILLPKSFEALKAIEEQPVVFPDAKSARQYLERVGPLKTSDERLMVEQLGTKLELSTFETKYIGQKYYANLDLQEAAGAQFYSIGGRMELQTSQIEKTLAAIYAQGWQLAAFSNKQQARDLLNIRLPQFERIQVEEVKAVEVPSDTSPQVPKTLPEISECLNEPTKLQSETKTEIELGSQDEETEISVLSEKTQAQESIEKKGAIEGNSSNPKKVPKTPEAVEKATATKPPKTKANHSPAAFTPTLFDLSEYVQPEGSFSQRTIESSSAWDVVDNLEKKPRSTSQTSRKEQKSLTSAVLEPKSNFQSPPVFRLPETAVPNVSPQSQQEREQLAIAIAQTTYRYLSEYRKFDEFRGQFYTGKFNRQTGQLTLVDNSSGKIKLDVLQTQQGWQVRHEQLTPKDKENFAKIERLMKEQIQQSALPKVSPLSKEALEKVERVCNTMLQLLRQLKAQEYRGQNYNISYDAKEGRISLLENKTERVLLKAKYELPAKSWVASVDELLPEMAASIVRGLKAKLEPYQKEGRTNVLD